MAWVTGANGLIGNEIVRQADHELRWRPKALGRAELDLLKPDRVGPLFRADKPGAVIHCAALSKSVACEADPELARKINVDATRAMVEASAGIPFLFFSTDLVFDGKKGNYKEEDETNPLSVYAATKWEAEEIVRQHPQHIILRISLTGGKSPTGDRGFNEEMRNAWKAGKVLNLFVDEYRCPMPAWVAARAAWELLGQGATGTYHLNGAERLSRLEIGQLVAGRHPELEPRIVATSRADYKGPPRPPDTSMNCEKAQRLLSFPIPAFSEWLEANPEEDF